MTAIKAIFSRELKSYFSTPLAYVFIVIFLILNGIFTFSLGGFYERGQADLEPFFNFHPWLYLFLVSAISMRLWAEERKSGTIEILLTLPVRLHEAVVGKFLAAWVFLGVALALTFPVWVTVNYLGNPDNGIILAGYAGSWLMAGAFLAIGSCMSSLTSNQVIAFLLSMLVCFIFIMSGFPVITDAFEGWVPGFVLDTISATSFLTHFQDLSKGLLSLADISFFLIMIVGWLLATAIVIDIKKAD